MISLDLNINDAEALLNHCKHFVPASGDAREDRRLAHALEALAEALKGHMERLSSEAE